MKPDNIVLVAGGICTSLIAGLFYAFSIAVVPALRSLKATQHITIMQSINVKILNPLFLLSFMGPAILLPLATFLQRGKSQFGLLLAASIIYIVGVIGVTATKNVPLNDKLAKFEVNQLSESEAEQIRNDFQGPGSAWMRFHDMRTLAATTATALIFIACLSRDVAE
ncbi:membrane protein [Dictyobacter alpinus]|uniref:Membrane protein n=1 Tax=Dictyobacter alpinus TaxID=2014873 RepID=A0A402B516_9CHLR|nr:anthrone oxygenase family protein [Dictyobacter alpinus]GCE26438.1 membrane protein [Dictyobacter alpinus]